MVALLPGRVSKPLFQPVFHPHGPQRKPTSSRLCTEQRGCDPYLEWKGLCEAQRRGAWTLVPTEGLLYRSRLSRPEPTQGCRGAERRPRCSLFWGSCLYASLEITQLLGTGWARVNMLSSTDVTYGLSQGHTGETCIFNQHLGALAPGSAQFWGGLSNSDQA